MNDDVVDLTEGDPVRNPPAAVVEAARSALDSENAGYPPLLGLPEFREAAANRLESAGIPTNSERIVATTGATSAVYTCIQALVDPGDEVVVPRPSWHCYEPMVKLADGKLTYTQGPATSSVHPAEQAYPPLVEQISNETRLLILNSPTNPTGRVYNRDDLRAIRDLVIQRDVLVLADETYKYLTFDGHAPSIASVDGMSDQTITIRSFSKPYAMTDWRLGYLSSPKRFLDGISVHHSYSTSCVNRIAQRAGLAVFRNNNLHVPARNRYRNRRDLLVDEVRKRGYNPMIPEGTFYFLLPVDDNDTAWCRSALDETGVALTPGRVFGAPGYARLSATAPDNQLREALDRLFAAGFL